MAWAAGAEARSDPSLARPLPAAASGSRRDYNNTNTNKNNNTNKSNTSSNNNDNNKGIIRCPLFKGPLVRSLYVLVSPRLAI